MMTDQLIVYSGKTPTPKTLYMINLREFKNSQPIFPQKNYNSWFSFTIDHSTFLFFEKLDSNVPPPLPLFSLKWVVHKNGNVYGLPTLNGKSEYHDILDKSITIEEFCYGRNRFS